MTDDLRPPIIRALRRLTLATVGLYIFLALVVAGVWVDAGNRRAALERVAVQTNSALCTLRADLQRRVTDGERFLEEHPEGIPGISAADIVRSLDGQRRTIGALSGLECPPAL